MSAQDTIAWLLVSATHPRYLPHMTDHSPSPPDSILKALLGARKRFEQAERALEKARSEVKDLAIEALKAGAAPTEVAERSPYTAAHLRQIAREAGIPPAKKRGGTTRPSAGRLSGGSQ